MKEKIDKKIEEASEILKSLGMPNENQNKVAALTLLALSSLKVDDDWKNASRRGMIISKDIMEFSNKFYNTEYKANTRESFRKSALKPFVEYNIAELNPDDPNLGATSSKTHYALTTLTLNTIRKYGSQEWKLAAENFIKFNSELQDEKKSNIHLKRLSIKGFKSIYSDNIELGCFNVFIGANGSGKSNILESIAIAGASKANDLNYDGLYSRGVRMARPDQIISSFLADEQRSGIEINMSINDSQELFDYKFSLSPASQTDIFTKWVDLAEEELYPDILMDYFSEITNTKPGISGNDLLAEVNKIIELRGLKQNKKFDNYLTEYAIFDVNTRSLRGITADSKKTPLGVNGEGLDLLIASMSKSEKETLKTSRLLFNWLDDIISDKDDKLKLEGLKSTRSKSTLYFIDKFMNKKNNLLSAENSNEGILHVLFYLALMISDKTPKLFAIDNIETALNPWLCKGLIENLYKLSKQFGKQVLITTHNPAILDGLNLFDEDQRLFEVFRDDDGHTKTRRIKFKHDLSNKEFKLSQMWMSGTLGAVPRNF